MADQHGDRGGELGRLSGSASMSEPRKAQLGWKHKEKAPIISVLLSPQTMTARNSYLVLKLQGTLTNKILDRRFIKISQLQGAACLHLPTRGSLPIGQLKATVGAAWGRPRGASQSTPCRSRWLEEAGVPVSSCLFTPGYLFSKSGRCLLSHSTLLRKEMAESLVCKSKRRWGQQAASPNAHRRCLR